MKSFSCAALLLVATVSCNAKRSAEVDPQQGNTADYLVVQAPGPAWKEWHGGVSLNGHTAIDGVLLNNTAIAATIGIAVYPEERDAERLAKIVSTDVIRLLGGTASAPETFVFDGQKRVRVRYENVTPDSVISGYLIFLPLPGRSKGLVFASGLSRNPGDPSHLVNPALAQVLHDLQPKR